MGSSQNVIQLRVCMESAFAGNEVELRLGLQHFSGAEEQLFAEDNGHAGDC